MRLLKLFLVISVITALLSSGSLDAVKTTFGNMLAPDASASAEDQKTYDRLCPLLGVWADMDADGRAATSKTIRSMARKQAAKSDDPALDAFLAVVPEALADSSSVQSKAARALIERECRAHNN